MLASGISANDGVVSTRSRPKAAEASPETLAHQGLERPDSLRSSAKAKGEYSTAMVALPAFLIS